jgi:GWxTD domain-containing protein
LAAVLAGAAAGCAGGPVVDRRDAADLANPFLGPEHSVWLVGPIAGLATAAEIEGFLALRDDAAAAAFVEEFWRRRDPDPGQPGNPARELFGRRAVEADRRWSEAGLGGRRTDRGTIFVLYGEPSETRFDIAPRAEDPPLEVWVYDAEAPPGLDGRRPPGLVRFAKYGEVTTFYSPLRPRRDPRPRLPGEPPG